MSEPEASTPLLNAIVERAKNQDPYHDTFQLPERWMDSVLNPQFDDAGRIHDWRRHVHWLAVEFWEQLDFPSRLIIYLKSVEDADNEEWE